MGAPEFDREGVLAGVDALVRLAPTPREQFLLGNLERAEAMCDELYPDDGSVETFIRRELFLGMAVATGPVDADLLFGEGRDGSEASELRGLLGDG